MEKEKHNLEAELEELKQELEDYQAEKEQVRQLIGKVGGAPTFRTKWFNIAFGAAVAVFFVISLMSDGKLQMLMIELATIAISIKIMYLIYCQDKVNHFKFWVLSSIEWRLNEAIKLIKKIDQHPNAE